MDMWKASAKKRHARCHSIYDSATYLEFQEENTVENVWRTTTRDGSAWVHRRYISLLTIARSLITLGSLMSTKEEQMSTRSAQDERVKRTAFRIPAELMKRLKQGHEREVKATSYPITLAAFARKCMELGLAQLEKVK